jgi:hypothetical protein
LAGSVIALAALVGCGGTFTRVDDGIGGSVGIGGAGSSAGVTSSGGYAGKGGTAPYGGYAGNVSYAGDVSYGGDRISYGGTPSTGGGVSYGGTLASGGAISSGGEAGAPSCYMAPPPATPYTVKFTYTTNTPVYDRRSCGPAFQLFDCASASTPLVSDVFCQSECGSGSCSTCGSCPLTEDLVAPGMPLSDDWSGLTYSYGMSSGCTCVNTRVAPPGVYTVAVTRYLTQSDAVTQTNGYPTTVQFTLPAPGNQVTIDLGFQPL